MMKSHTQQHGHHHEGGGGHRNKGEGGYCVCPKCGYSLLHQAGIPCNTLFCKDCNITMQRSETQGNETVSTPVSRQMPNAEQVSKKLLFPKVDAQKCTGCGICIDVCPKEAIIMVHGKAFVKIDQCRNCKACIKACPGNAIILE